MDFITGKLKIIHYQSKGNNHEYRTYKTGKTTLAEVILRSLKKFNLTVQFTDPDIGSKSYSWTESEIQKRLSSIHSKTAIVIGIKQLGRNVN